MAAPGPNRSAMSAVEAKRTLVKSPPEVWAKVSDPAVLADHLADLGAIRITHVEPESVVLWEGDRVSGGVHLDPGGWGTKVRFTAEWEEPEPEPVVAEPEPEPVAVLEPEPEPVTVAEPVAVVVAEPEPVVVEDVVPVAEPAAVAEPETPGRRGFFSWFRRRRKAVEEPEPVAEAPAPEPEAPAPVAEAPAEAPSPIEEPEPVTEPEPAPEPVTDPEPAPEPVGDPEPAATATDHLDPQAALAVLEAALDRLGAAHHRPFSRG